MDSLETLLRATTLAYGNIGLHRSRDGLWFASISHFSDHLTKDCKGYGDPVEALRVALIEDARVTADQVRKYKGAAKLGGWKEKSGFPTFPRDGGEVAGDSRQIDLEEAIASAGVEDLVGALATSISAADLLG